MITAKGVGFLIAAILVFFLARLTQVGWLYLVDPLLWGIILLSAFLPWLGVPFLDARRKLSWEGPEEGIEERPREGSGGKCSELRGSEQPAAFQEGIETSGPPGAKEGCQGHLAVGALP